MPTTTGLLYKIRTILWRTFLAFLLLFAYLVIFFLFGDFPSRLVGETTTHGFWECIYVVIAPCTSIVLAVVLHNHLPDKLRLPEPLNVFFYTYLMGVANVINYFSTCHLDLSFPVA